MPYAVLRPGSVEDIAAMIRYSRADWIRQYGDLWPAFVRRKQRFDPDNILTPGPGIF